MRPTPVFTEGMFQTLFYSYTKLILQPQFEKALEDKHISAWSGSMTMSALAAMEFLRLKKVRVPKDISVEGFDDVLEAFANGLTSYNFYISGYVHAMLDHILTKRKLHRKKSGTPIEIEGTTIIRNSTGAARR
jgi:DNA-binding LacI/PurR family transcriptional regulator